ncbi:MAG: DivIVA domain-containing protein [Actinomycetota bacterium]|nr:DivIVA domain-containing protein [Actinomycetota bacterium]
MQPELTPEEIETASFTIGLRGYDKQEVEDYLVAVADHIRVISDVSRSAYVDLGDEMGQLLQHARDSADEMTRKAQEEATSLRAEVDAEAADKRRDADEYRQRAKDEVGEEVKRIREGAEEQARGIIEDAQRRIVTLQQEEVEARERIRALRLQLLEVTLRLQRFEVAEEAAEEAEAEAIEEFEPGAPETLETSALDEPTESDGADDSKPPVEATTVDFSPEAEGTIRLDENAKESHS